MKHVLNISLRSHVNKLSNFGNSANTKTTDIQIRWLAKSGIRKNKLFQ